MWDVVILIGTLALVAGMLYAFYRRQTTAAAARITAGETQAAVVVEENARVRAEEATHVTDPTEAAARANTAFRDLAERVSRTGKRH